MKTYRDFKYIEVSPGMWKITYPHGHRFFRELATEQDVKNLIDEIIESVGGP